MIGVVMAAIDNFIQGLPHWAVAGALFGIAGWCAYAALHRTMAKRVLQSVF